MKKSLSNQCQDYIGKIICFARALGGNKGNIVFDFVKLIVVVSDWGYHYVWVNNNILYMARILIDNSDLEKRIEKLEFVK